MLLPSRADEVHVQIEGIVVLHNNADEVHGHGEIVVLLASRTDEVHMYRLLGKVHNKLKI